MQIPDPKVPRQGNYSFGKTADLINHIKDLRPRFAFDYISLSGTKFCWNSNLMNGQRDYHKLLGALKKISTKSYDELSRDQVFHFHEVDFKEITISKSEFLKCLVPDIGKVNHDQAPTIYQFKTFEQARVLGFIFAGIFHVVFFDRNHQAYKRK